MDELGSEAITTPTRVELVDSRFGSPLHLSTTDTISETRSYICYLITPEALKDKVDSP